MTNKILFALTSHYQKGNTGQHTGFYLPEAAHPWAVLNEAGFEIDFVSPKGGKPPIDGVDLNDPISRNFMQDPQVARKIEKTAKPSDMDFRDYAAIFFVGGHGAMWDFPHDHHLAEFALGVYENGGIVSAVCHGPAALVNLKLKNGQYLVAGKRLAAFTDDEEQAVELDRVVPFLLASTLRHRGAHQIPASNWQANVIVDGRLITGQNPASAEGVGKEIARLLLEK